MVRRFILLARLGEPCLCWIRYYQSNGVSEYDSVTVTLRHQSSSGFQGQIFYTFSKALDDSSVESPAESLRSAQSIMYPGRLPSRLGTLGL